MRAPLKHVYPSWQPAAYVWGGKRRVVSAKRARALRKRGVWLLPLHAILDQSSGAHAPGCVEPVTPGNGPGKRSARYAWFVEEINPTRAVQQFLARRARAKARRAERMREMLKHTLVFPEVLLMLPYWQDESLSLAAIDLGEPYVSEGPFVSPEEEPVAYNPLPPSVSFRRADGGTDVVSPGGSVTAIDHDHYGIPYERFITGVEYVTPGSEHQAELNSCVRCGSLMRTNLFGVRVCPACDG